MRFASGIRRSARCSSREFNAGFNCLSVDFAEGRALLLRLGQRDLEDGGGAFWGDAFEVEFSAEVFCYAAADGEAEAGAGGAGGVEGFEDAAEIFGADAGAGIADAEFCPLAALAQGDLYLAGLGAHGFAGIEEEIEKELSDGACVAGDDEGLGGEVCDELKAGRGAFLHELDNAVDFFVEGDGLGFAGLGGAGEAEEVSDEIAEALGFADDVAAVFCAAAFGGLLGADLF